MPNLEKTLFLGDLSILTHELDLLDELQRFGHEPSLNSVKVMRGTDSHPRGYGFVSFFTREEAVAAMEGMEGHAVHGRKLRIKFAARRIVDMTPLTCEGPVHSVHVTFVTKLMSNFDGAWTKTCRFFFSPSIFLTILGPLLPL